MIRIRRPCARVAAALPDLSAPTQPIEGPVAQPSASGTVFAIASSLPHLPSSSRPSPVRSGGRTRIESQSLEAHCPSLEETTAVIVGNTEQGRSGEPPDSHWAQTNHTSRAVGNSNTRTHALSRVKAPGLSAHFQEHPPESDPEQDIHRRIRRDWPWLCWGTADVC